MSKLQTFRVVAVVIAVCALNTAAQLPKEPQTMREVLGANGISNVGSYPEHFLNAKVVPGPNERYIRLPYHINPSAEELFVFSRDLKLVGQLYGWELLTLPNDGIVYHRSEIHFAPTHSVEISVFDPVNGKDKQIYPPKPYQPVRKAFVERVSKVYKERGEAWFRQHNHHMDAEMFDSRLVNDVRIDSPTKSISFTVRYGDPDNAGDPLPFSQLVLVTCAPVDAIEQLKCRERAR